MTTAEFSSELDVIYENINANNAPGLDTYEKSVILTHAQELLLKEVLKSEPSGDRFPDLISVHTDNSPVAGLLNNSAYIFSLPSGYFKILNEQIENVSGIQHIVLAISNEQLQQKLSKPYVYPPRRRAWRISMDNTGGSVEIYVRNGFTPTLYTCRYLRKPVPIVLDTISPAIDGVTTTTQCELDSGLHRDILKIAATLAEHYYMDKYSNTESNDSRRN